MITFGSFANEIKVDKKKKTDVTACCTQTGSSGSSQTRDYMYVIITICVSGPTQAEARVAACARASKAVTKSLELADVSVDLISKPKN